MIVEGEYFRLDGQFRSGFATDSSSGENTSQHESPSRHANSMEFLSGRWHDDPFQHERFQKESKLKNKQRNIKKEKTATTMFYDREDEVTMSQSRQMIEHSLEQDIMNELYDTAGSSSLYTSGEASTTGSELISVEGSATALTYYARPSILSSAHTKYGMVTGRIARRDEQTPESQEEALAKQEEMRNHPIVKELIQSDVLPERVIDLVDRLRDELRLEHLSAEQYQAIFQKHISAWLELDNPTEAQESFCRYFESWYRLQVQIGSLPFMGRPKMQNRQLYMKLAASLAESGELHMVQKMAQGYTRDYVTSHIVFERDSRNLLHSSMRAYIKRSSYVELMLFFTQSFETTFGRIPLEYDACQHLTTPNEQTFRIMFDGFFTLRPSKVSAEELIPLLVAYRDECSNSSEKQVREWAEDLINYLIKREKKMEAARDVFIQVYHSSLNQFNPNGLQPHLYDYQSLLELYAAAGEKELFDSIFHALLTDENVGLISDAFYALRVKVFASNSLAEGLDKFNTHFSSDVLKAYSDVKRLSARAFYDPVREPHYVAIVALSDAAAREENLDMGWRCLEAYEQNCPSYSKEVHQYLYTNLLRICLALDMQQDALDIFKDHFRSPLFATPEDTTDFAIFEDVDDACMLFIESFLRSGDVDMAVRFLEIMQSPPDFVRSHVNQMRKKIDEAV